MDEKELNNEENVKSSGRKRSTGAIIPVLAIITACCVLFSVMQTIFVLRLMSGQTGNMTYTAGRTEDDSGNADESADEAESLTASAAANPEFSLELAASVTDPDKETLSIVDIVRLASPATVTVYVMGNVNNRETPVYSGTGFIISEDGYIVTNEHVVSPVHENSDYYLKVIVPGYEIPIEALLVGSDVQTDIAVLKIDEQDEPYSYVTLGDSDSLQVGELVVAIGNPLGRLEGTVTVGVVSAVNREVNNNGYTMDLLQTDASINTGNSGGPLINSFGEVIGITNSKITTGEGLGFAIPISEVRDVIQSIINYGYVHGRPYLGVTVGQIASDAYYGAIAGVYVAEVDANGPADKAGMAEGDRIVSIDGVQINESSDIIDVRDNHVPGDTVTVVVDRDGREVELQLTIGDSNDAE